MSAALSHETVAGFRAKSRVERKAISADRCAAMRGSAPGREGPTRYIQRRRSTPICTEKGKLKLLWGSSRGRVDVSRRQSPRPLATMATPGRGIIAGLAPIDDGIDSGATRGGIDGDIEGGGKGFMPETGAPVLTSVRRESIRRVANFHSPHQSSSRTWGQTPSIMYDLALIGCNIGASRRHWPHCVAALPSFDLTLCRS